MCTTTCQKTQNSLPNQHTNKTITLGKQKYIYNTYNPPCDSKDITRQLEQLTKDAGPRTFIYGDFNAHHLDWGDNHTDYKGMRIQRYI
ncbi:hypothetical protein CHS0354_017583, partial [Potamilus streckersoni]